MTGLKIRDARAADFDAILALNEASVSLLSPLSPERLAGLHAQAALHRVVADAARGHGVGTLLYRDLFDIAAASAVRLVTCEFDVDPPNLVSERFHAGFGFREVGRQWVADGSKQVSLQAAPAQGTSR